MPAPPHSTHRYCRRLCRHNTFPFLSLRTAVSEAAPPFLIPPFTARAAGEAVSSAALDHIANRRSTARAPPLRTSASASSTAAKKGGVASSGCAGRASLQCWCHNQRTVWAQAASLTSRDTARTATTGFRFSRSIPFPLCCICNFGHKK